MSNRRKSSSHVTLVLAGTAALVGCGREPAERGKRYASQAECVADWGSPEDCKESVSTHNGHAGSAWMYYGAGSMLRNSMGYRAAPASGVSEPASGTAPRSVSRGGFGSTGRTGASS